MFVLLVALQALKKYFNQSVHSYTFLLFGRDHKLSISLESLYIHLDKKDLKASHLLSMGQYLKNHF